jgi:hypothetical protein
MKSYRIMPKVGTTDWGASSPHAPTYVLLTFFIEASWIQKMDFPNKKIKRYNYYDGDASSLTPPLWLNKL